MKKQTASMVSESLTGFDEIAIKQHFGATIRGLTQDDPTQYLRALVFVLERRAGKKDPEAYHVAQSMSLIEVKDRLPMAADDADADFDEQPRTTKP